MLTKHICAIVCVYLSDCECFSVVKTAVFSLHKITLYVSCFFECVYRMSS